MAAKTTARLTRLRTAAGASRKSRSAATRRCARGAPGAHAEARPAGLVCILLIPPGGDTGRASRLRAHRLFTLTIEARELAAFWGLTPTSRPAVRPGTKFRSFKV
jgi:hypothetical protein